MTQIPFALPLSLVKNFHKKDSNLRWGQEFHSYAELDKLTSPDAKAYADKIYEAEDELAKQLVNAIADINN